VEMDPDVQGGNMEWGVERGESSVWWARGGGAAQFTFVLGDCFLLPTTTGLHFPTTGSRHFPTTTGLHYRHSRLLVSLSLLMLHGACLLWLQVTEVINELYNMRVVGWYHSHPSFPALPSVIDIANQLQVRGSAGYLAKLFWPLKNSKPLPWIPQSQTLNWRPCYDI